VTERELAGGKARRSVVGELAGGAVTEREREREREKLENGSYPFKNYYYYYYFKKIIYFLFKISGQVARGNCPAQRTWPNFGHVAL
jgi:hypothetical protein